MSDFLYNYTNASGAPITIKIYKRGIWWHIQQISPTIRAYGEDFVSKGEAMEYLNLNAVNTKQVPHKVKKRENLYQCDFSCKKAIAIADLLYKDSTIYLQRKYDTYRDFLNFSEEELV